MTKDEALKLALEALETTGAKSSDQWQKERKAITAIKQATAQPAPVQEPVATNKIYVTREQLAELYPPPAAQPAPVQESVGTYGEIFESMLSLLRTGLQRDQQIYMEMKDKPLFTTPPAAQRQWVGLSQDELDAMFSNTIKGKKLVNWVARAIEAKLKEKNT